MATPGRLSIPSMQDRCSAAEWNARVDLAACYRLVDLYGMSDMMANHISSHVPGEAGAFLINPYGMMYEEITASSLIKVDTAGAILSSLPASVELVAAGGSITLAGSLRLAPSDSGQLFVYAAQDIEAAGSLLVMSDAPQGFLPSALRPAGPGGPM